MHAPIPRNFNPAHSPVQFDNPFYAFGIGPGLLVSQQHRVNTADKKSKAASDAVAKEAEQKALMAQQEADKTGAARRALLDQSTSGFGPNKNLARSFLTTL